MTTTYDDLKNTSGIVVEKVVGVGDIAKGPKAGDVVYFRNSQGQSFITTANSDGSLADPVPSSRISQPSRRAGAADYPTPDEIAADPVAAAKKHYSATTADPTASATDIQAAYDNLVKLQNAANAAASRSKTVDAKTKAMADSADAMIKAGRVPSASDRAAWEEVYGSSAQGQTGGSQVNLQPTGSATLDWLQQQAQAGKTAGWQRYGEATSWDPNQKGQSVGVAKGSTVPLPTGTVTAVTPWGYGDYAVSVQEADGTTITVGHIEKPDFKVGDQIGGNNTVTVRGDASPISSGPHADVRVQNAQGDYIDPMQYVGADQLPHGYSSSAGTGSGLAIPPAQNRVTVHSLGPGQKLVAVDNSTNESRVLDSVPGQHSHFALGPTEYDYDPSTGAATPLVTKPGPMTEAWQNYHDTIDLIAKNIAGGALTPQQATDWQGKAWQTLQAAQVGTTLWDMQKEEQQTQIQRAQIARDLLTTQVQESSKMADSLLGQAITALNSSEYGWMHLPADTLSNLYGGALQEAEKRAEPLTDLAQSLLQPFAQQAAAKGLDPRIPMPGMAGSAAPAAPAAGPSPFDAATQAAQVPSGAPLPPWMQQPAPSPVDDPLPEAA